MSIPHRVYSAIITWRLLHICHFSGTIRQEEQAQMNEPPKQPPPPQRTSPEDSARRILRRLQGEDGYDIFADHPAGDDRERWRREQEDNRP